MSGGRETPKADPARNDDFIVDEDYATRDLTALDAEDPRPPDEDTAGEEIMEEDTGDDVVEERNDLLPRAQSPKTQPPKAQPFSFKRITSMLSDYELTASSASSSPSDEKDVDVVKLYCLFKYRMMIFILACIALVIVIAAIVMVTAVALTAKLVADTHSHSGSLLCQACKSSSDCSEQTFCSPFQKRCIPITNRNCLCRNATSFRSARANDDRVQQQHNDCMQSSCQFCTTPDNSG